MLVLTRSKGETIVIGDDVTVTILGVGRSRCTCAAQHDGVRVQIGIDAPRDLRVLRGEIFDEVRRANLVSLGAADGSSAARAESLAGTIVGLAQQAPAPAIGTAEDARELPTGAHPARSSQ